MAKKGEKMVSATFRLPERQIDLLDYIASYVHTKSGKKTSKSEIVRELVADLLALKYRPAGLEDLDVEEAVRKARELGIDRE